jgi:hypothetical protein
MINKAIIAIAVAATLAACTSGTGATGGQQNPVPAKQSCAPGDNNYSWCINNPDNGPTLYPAPLPANTVKSKATNPGVGQVTGVCHFSIIGPMPDSTGDSGIRVEKQSVLVYIAFGTIWGYCTDTMHDFVLDVYLAYNGKQVAHVPFKGSPGPVNTSHIVSTHCVPGTYQIAAQYVGKDPAGNIITGQLGGKPKYLSAADCGLNPAGSH